MNDDVEMQEQPVEIQAPEIGASLPPNTNDLLNLTNLIHAEARSEKEDVKTMVGSSALNRLESKRKHEFGSNLEEIIAKGYSSYNDPDNPGFDDGRNLRFVDDNDESSWKESLQIASGLIGGTIPRMEVEFFHTPEEIVRQSKINPETGKPFFDYKQMKTHGTMKTSVGSYKIMSYKKRKK